MSVSKSLTEEGGDFTMSAGYTAGEGVGGTISMTAGASALGDGGDVVDAESGAASFHLGEDRGRARAAHLEDRLERLKPQRIDLILRRSAEESSLRQAASMAEQQRVFRRFPLPVGYVRLRFTSTLIWRLT